MQNFSSIYEKLIDMGFANDAIDAAIKKGLYTFDMIFNELIETDPDFQAYSESNNYNKTGNLSQPILKLRANHHSSIFDGSLEDKLLDTNFFDTTESSGLNKHSTFFRDRESFQSPFNKDDSIVNPEFDDNSGFATALQLEKFNTSLDRHIAQDPAEKERYSNNHKTVGIQFSKVISSTMSSSLLSNSTTEISRNKMTKIQIMDLLDPAFEPITFSHPFLSSICTIRDLICWFHQCRYSVNRVNLPSYESRNSRLAISSDTSLNLMIEMFQQLKWHLVMPSGAQSTRIYGNEYLDKTIESIGLNPSAHLLAVISCPTELQKQTSIKDGSLKSMSSSFSMVNGNHNRESSVSLTNHNNCCVQIRMINYLSNSMSLQGKTSYELNCDPDKMTLEKIALDFSSVCQMDTGTFTLLKIQPRQVFSYPDDYQRTLSELGLTGNVILYCHSLNDNISYHINNSSGESLNMSTDVASIPTSSPIHVPTIEQYDYRTETELIDSNIHVQPFSGIGIALSGSYSNKTIAELWADRQLEIALPDPPDTCVKRKPKSLFYFCFQVIYRCLKTFSNAVCKSMKKLPNNIQQIFIKLLLDEKLLTPSLLSFFCAPGSCLTSLDLSYNLLATNELLKCISKCSSLRELILDNEEHTFSNEGLWHLRYLTHLKRLSLNYCSKINDWGIQVVGVLPALSVLAIKYTSITNVGLKHIYLHLNSEIESVVVPPLKSIDLTGLSVSDECLSCLAIFTRLEILNLSSTHITNPSLFPHLSELRHLDISHCHELIWETRLHIKSLCESFPNLSSINVRGVSNSNLVHITMAISHCKHIRQLDGIFCHSQMTASLVASLSHLPLETIILTNCRHVTDLWLPVLARFSATLTHLVLSSCSSITGENNSILNNLRRLRNLSWLDLTHLENVNVKQIYQLVLGNYFSKLQVAWISLNEQQEIEFRSHSQNLRFKVNVTKSLINSLDLVLSLTDSQS